MKKKKKIQSNELWRFKNTRLKILKVFKQTKKRKRLQTKIQTVLDFSKGKLVFENKGKNAFQILMDNKLQSRISSTT